MKSHLQKIIKRNWKWMFGFLIIEFLAFHKILFDLNNTLVDRYDYPYYAWVLYQNYQHILGGTISSYFDTTAFYPLPYGMLFSDVLLPQALLGLPMYLVSKSIIATLNSVFLINILLNFIGLFAIWKSLVKNSRIAFLGGILFVFGPFFHTQVSHFQMMSYWPGLFALYALFYIDKKQTFVRIFIASILLAVQFLASVYSFVFISTIIAAHFGMKMLSKKNMITTVKNGLLVFGLTGIWIYPILKGYYAMKSFYGLQREMGEYILYSAHITDYLFTRGYRTLFYNFDIFNKWNAFNMHLIGENTLFPGFILLILAGIGLVTYSKSINGRIVGMTLTKESLLYIGIGLIGLFFSFGPRLSANGVYIHIPNIYLLAQMVVPLLESIRSPGRWSFLLYFALTYFAVYGMLKVRVDEKLLLFWGILALLCIEVVPLNFPAQKVVTDFRDYTVMKELCAEQQHTMLEYPVTHFTAYGGIAEGLSYVSNILLAQTYHGCRLVNGYSGHIPPQTFSVEKSMDDLITGAALESNVEDLHSYLLNENISILKLNKKHVLPEYMAGFIKIQEDIRSNPDLFESIDDNQTIFLIKDSE